MYIGEFEFFSPVDVVVMRGRDKYRGGADLAFVAIGPHKQRKGQGGGPFPLSPLHTHTHTDIYMRASPKTTSTPFLGKKDPTNPNHPPNKHTWRRSDQITLFCASGTRGWPAM